MSSPPPPDDPTTTRDAHLLAALRHAPDRDVAPPALLTAAILGQARQALRPRWRERWRAAWAGLWQPVPLAAFGTLAMATLIGVLWSGGELPDAAPGRRPDAAAGLPPGAAAPAVAETAAASAAPSAATAAPAESAVAEARQDAAQESRSLRDVEALAKSSADHSAPARARSEAAPPSLGAAMAPTVATPLAAPSAEIDAAASADTSRVRWQLTPLRVVGHGAAQRDWWSALMSTTRGRWQRVQDSATGGAPAALTLLIDGTPRGSLGFETDAVVWRDALSGATWRAPLSAEVQLAWRGILERW